jgi:ribosomal protein S25
MNKPQEINQQFVLGEVVKIREELHRLIGVTDNLYGSLLYEEVRKYVEKCKTMTGDKLRKKFSIGYGVSGYILAELVENGVVESTVVGEKVVYVLKKSG